MRGQLKWYAVDFDNTLCKTTGPPHFRMGEPIEENIRKLNEVIDEGYKIIIHTARHWEDYEAVEDWLQRYEVPYRRIICGKVLAHRYVDDKAIAADEEDWLR